MPFDIPLWAEQQATHRHRVALPFRIPELLEIVGNECLSDLIAVSNPPSDQEDIASVAVKAAYGKLMLSDPDKVSALVNRLQARLSEDNPDLEIILPQDHPINLSSVFQVYLRLAQEFPGDVGCFSLFFLNYIKLEPGQAVYLEYQITHLYVPYESRPLTPLLKRWNAFSLTFVGTLREHFVSRQHYACRLRQVSVAEEYRADLARKLLETHSHVDDEDCLKDRWRRVKEAMLSAFRTACPAHLTRLNERWISS
ncbi:mannose-6-phosphate isomerase [Clonorchis sinensis]|uniref:Mannose-6-phosphate isomerase n=1 Tax=Clonorchis sinensis TaxID=79923 RepID=H2KQA3_CLOSI|nr:mannose-6-phosphate isomerase [Clonorchis sinensis]